MSTFVWRVSDALEDGAAEQHQGGTVELENLKTVSGSPAWAIEESRRTPPIKPIPGGTVELAHTGAPEGAAQGGVADFWGISTGVKNFIVLFIVLIFGIIIFVVAMRDSGTGNLTFGKLVEELGLLLTGLVGGTLLKFRR